MNQGASEQVRAVAMSMFVQPALQAGKLRFSVPVKELLRELVAQGFPAANTPQVCSALRKKEFLFANGIEIEGIDGPPSKVSTTVVYRYRVKGQSHSASESNSSKIHEGEAPCAEPAEEWAERVTAGIRGLLKDEITQMGGAEAYIRWVRSEDEDAA